MTLAQYVVILLSYGRLYNRNVCSLQTVPDTVTGHPGLSHWGCALTVNTTDCPWPWLSVSWSCLRRYSGHNYTLCPWPWLSVSWSCLRRYSGHNYTLCPWPWLSVSWSCLRRYSGNNYTHCPWPWLGVSWSCLRRYSGNKYTHWPYFVIMSQAVQWQWQYTADSNPKSGLWMNMETSVLLTIVTNRTITSHNCFNISTTNLTFERVSRSDFGKYYRCYVMRGDTEYVQYAAVYKLRENKKKLGNPHSGAALVGRVGVAYWMRCCVNHLSMVMGGVLLLLKHTLNVTIADKRSVKLICWIKYLSVKVFA